jgi:hypothetical protein
MNTYFSVHQSHSVSSDVNGDYKQHYVAVQSQGTDDEYLNEYYERDQEDGDVSEVIGYSINDNPWQFLEDSSSTRNTVLQ